MLLSAMPLITPWRHDATRDYARQMLIRERRYAIFRGLAPCAILPATPVVSPCRYAMPRHDVAPFHAIATRRHLPLLRWLRFRCRYYVDFRHAFSPAMIFSRHNAADKMAMPICRCHLPPLLRHDYYATSYRRRWLPILMMIGRSPTQHAMMLLVLLVCFFVFRCLPRT